MKKHSRALYMRAYRARKKAEASLFDADALAGYPDDPAGAIAEWSEERLVVPPGHPRAGEADEASSVRARVPSRRFPAWNP